MKQIILVIALIICSLILISPTQAFANSGHDDGHSDNHFSFSSFHSFFGDKKKSFDDFWNNHFKHDDKNDKDHGDKGDGTNNGDGSAPCDCTKTPDDPRCVVQAPEYSGLMAPMTFMITATCLWLAKKRSLI